MNSQAVTALAEGGNTVASSLKIVAGQITSTVAEIAPIAIGIFGLFLVWKFGKKFFTSVAK